MSSESDGKLSNQQLIERNRKPLSVPPQITVECPNARECFERILAEQRRTNELLSALPTRENLAAMRPPAKKQAGRRSAKRSSINWRRVRQWLWDRLPKPSPEWLIVVPLGGSAWLVWFLLNRIADSISSITRGLL